MQCSLFWNAVKDIKARVVEARRVIERDERGEVRKVSDWQPSGACALLCVIKNNYIWTEQKGQIWHFGSVRGKGTSTGCTPWSPSLPASPLLAISPSITETWFIHLPAVTFFIFFLPALWSAAAESIEFQKHWGHPSRKCAPNTAPLWPVMMPGFCFVRGYQVEQRWPQLRPNGHPGELLRGPGRRRGWWISLNYIWGTVHVAPWWMLKTFLQPVE